MRRVAFALAALWILTAPLPVMAFTPRAGDAVVVSEDIRDDLSPAGGTVEVPAASLGGWILSRVGRGGVGHG